jgi:hypothetical protein
LLIYTDARVIVIALLMALQGTAAALQLSSPNGHQSLFIDLASYATSMVTSNDLDVRVLIPLLTKTIDNVPDADIWEAVYDLVRSSNSPPKSRPTTPRKGDNDERDETISHLRKNWTNSYYPDSLNTLKDMIRLYESQVPWKAYYARTLVFVQSSGMGKSRLADAFGKQCPMINFVLRGDKTHGYPPPDSEVVSFMCKEPSENDKETITKSPKKLKIYSLRSSPADAEEGTESSETKKTELFLESMVATVWNHSIAVGLLQASFEMCRLCPLFLITKAMC